MAAHPNYARLGQHRLDPPATHAYVAVLAPRLAAGLISVDDCLLILVEHAHQAGYKGDWSGLRARLAWALADQADAITSARNRAEARIRKLAWKAVDALKPPDVILRGAMAEAGPLAPTEVKSIVADVADAWLRQRRYRHG